jgi:single-strand DNA-binding protein
MASLNKVFLMGNLTREPELRHTNSGMAVCEMGLAVSRRFVSNGQEKDEVCFVDIVAWGRQGETCQRYIHKGDPILIEGRLQLDQWQDKQTGASRSKLRVVADRVQFLSRPGRPEEEMSDGDQYGGYQQQPQQSQQRQNSPWQQQPQNNGSWQQPQNNSSWQNNSKSQQGHGGGAPPQMPGGAFDVDGAEDDIPF